MQHADISSSHNVNQLASLNVSNLNKVWFESQDVRVGESKGVRIAFP